MTKEPRPFAWLVHARAAMQHTENGDKVYGGTVDRSWPRQTEVHRNGGRPKKTHNTTQNTPVVPSPSLPELHGLRDRPVQGFLLLSPHDLLLPADSRLGRF